MISMELLDALAGVKEAYILEAHSSDISQSKVIPMRRISSKRKLMLIALVAVMLMLMGCALVIMRLQELKIGEYTYQKPYIENASEITSDVISLQGMEGSKNYQAAKEWNDFYDNYDLEGLLYNEPGPDDYIAPIDYMAYSCYSQEMQDKIDEICEKYELELLGPIYTNIFAVINMYEYDWQRTMSSGKLFNEDIKVTAELVDGYFYRGGTFMMEGTTTMNYKGSPWKYPVSYQYRCVMKNAFDAVCLTIGNMKEYEQWNCTLSDGSKVLLGIGENRGLILVDKETHFISINVLDVWAEDETYGWQKMDKKSLEAFANTFSFTYEPVKPNEQMLVEPQYFDE